MTTARTTPMAGEDALIIDMIVFGRALAIRTTRAGDPVVPRNTGARRTASKRALLKAIEVSGGKW